MQDIFAVFLWSKLPGGKVAGVVRKDGTVALPGGKVDEGEDPVQALYRECSEEGWQVTATPEFMYYCQVEGKTVAWYKASSRPCKPREGDNSSPKAISKYEALSHEYNKDFKLYIQATEYEYGKGRHE